jgi:RecD/TraA family predicted helicase
MIKMADLLKKEMWIVKKYGIATKTLEKIKGYYGGYWGKEWFEKFKENPYLTMAMDGVGFKRADTYAQKLGFDMLSPIRVTACIVSTVEESSNGDTILELPKIIKTMVNELKVHQELIMNCILSCEGEYILLDSKYKTLSKYEIDNGSFPVYITTPLWYSTERYIFEWSKELEKKDREKVDWNIIEKVLEKNPTLNKEQKYAVEHFFDENFNMLIGVSGGGKSYLTKVLLDLLDSYGMTYTLLAPTGIASFNLTEKTGRESQTIHRRYATDNRITTDYVIIDEFGMCSCQHIDMLKYLVIDRTKTKPLFIGDKYQLPSISAGDFLSSIMNLLKCGRLKGNIFELTQIMRASNESYIPYLCNMFCGNNRFEAPVMNKRDLKGVEFYDREVELFSQIERIIKTKGWDWKETAVIMPQRKGENGCDAFNLYMQEKNKSEILYDDGYKVFKKNDMLMHIKNNTSLGIYNGELIEILDKYNCKTIDDEGIPVEKTFYRIKRLYDEKILDYDEDIVATQIMLSYANSVHKTQGATIKNVIFVGINDFSFMLSRNLTYVGLSRASENLVVICDKDAMVKASFKSLTDKRKTFLNLLCK